MNNTHSSRARSTVLPLVLTALFAALTAIGVFHCFRAQPNLFSL